MQESLRRVDVRIGGAVQGVGFRPWVYRLASEFGLSGFVRNDRRGVRIDVEGGRAAVASFLDRLTVDAPALATVGAIASEDLPPTGRDGFAIVESDGAGTAATVIAPDAATCAECVAELFDRRDRRYRYPFIACTECGPRFTIVQGIPYDRGRTAMATFVMCAACRAEYDDPRSRRFHAQAIACPACGPRVRLVDAGGMAIAGERDAIDAAVRALASGAIVALKGLGGFHLACRADDEAAVRRLRTRKRREARPFAIMVPNLRTARALAELDVAGEGVLAGKERPIVLAPRRAGTTVAAAVAPGGRDLGLMLPYTPLHHLVVAGVGVPLVMTSGNASGEPIVHDDVDAVTCLRGIADLLLLHDRPIEARADDSVVRMVAIRGRSHALPIRRSRGAVPTAVALPVATPAPLLAVGGELKVACAIASDGQAVLTQHLGDLGGERAYRAMLAAVAHLRALLVCEPVLVAHDRHPGYRSTAYAESFGLERLPVQHHHAHVASCLADNGSAGPAIGVAWDGTGYGTDGTVWGGEFLIADLAGFRRAARLEQVPLPGGDAAVREPWRMAGALLLAAYGETATDLDLALVRRIDHAAWRVLERVATGAIGAPRTSSAGRLFDGVAALLGLGDRASFEAEAAMRLEAAAGERADRTYAVRIDDVASADTSGPCAVVRTTDLVRGVVEDLLGGVATGHIAARFHATLAQVIVAVCTRLRDATGLTRVALTGGVFQNAILLGAAADALGARGFDVLVHRRVPPNDGGLALGQAAIAARHLAGRAA